MLANPSKTGLSRKPFRTRRAYRRYLKRQQGRTAARPVSMDTHKGLETLEQRVLLSASPVFELSDLLAANGGDGTEGVVINGVTADDRAGISVASAGDMNGDGYDDLIIGAFRDTPNGVDSGSAYVVFGQAGGFSASLQLSSLNGSNGFKLNGIAASNYAGRSVAGVGDVNGDGYDDLIIGAYGASPNGASAGQAYVVYGQAGAFAATIELSALNGSNGFTIDGLSAGDELGFSVSGAGDVNGDGLGDFLIGAALDAPHGATAAGSAYLVFGQTGFGSSFDLATLNGSNGMVVQGVSTDDQLGITASGAGDVNGDGLDDVIVGVHMDDTNGADAGAAYVIFGKTSYSFGFFDPTSINGSNGFAINGEAAGDNAGRSVSSAGDFNGDGYADVLVGAPFAIGSTANAGAAYVVFGHSGAFPIMVEASTLNGTDGFQLNGIDTDDLAGTEVNSAGDVNGDGMDDLLISADSASPNGTRSGEAYLVLGRSTTMPATITLSSLSGADGFVLNGIDTRDRAGISVNGAGDVDGDGFEDFLIGAYLADPNGNASGESYLLFGGDFSDAVTHLGSALNDALIGSAGADNMVAGIGNDTLTSNGGADVMLGGAGDDEFILTGGGFARIDGGSGTDTLVLAGDGTSLDLTGTAKSRLNEIEQISLTGDSSTVTLDYESVLNMTGNSNTLTVTVNISGTVNRGSGWTLSSSQIVSGNQQDTYTQGNATLIIVTEADVIDPVVTVDTLVTDTASPALTGTVIDLDPATTVTVAVDGADYTATNNGDGTWRLPAGALDNGLPDGVYDVQAAAEDSAGNIGNDMTTGELTLDQTAPIITVDSVYTNTVSPELTGTVDDLDPAVTVEVAVNGNTFTATNNGDGTWTLPAGTITPDLTEGVYDVSVAATDWLSQVGHDATSNELTIDQTAPVMTIDDPGSQSNGSPEITGTIDDLDTSALVEVQVNGVFFTATNNGDGTWTLPAGTITPALADGDYTVYARGTDAAGNIHVTDPPATLTIDSPPVITIDPRSTSDQTPEITGTISETNLTGDILVTVNGIQYAATNNGDNTWTLPDDTILPGDALPAGTYDVQVTATDLGGNPGSDTTTDELVIDISAPVVTVDTLISNQSSPELTGTVSGDVASIEVTVDGNAYAATDNGDGTWTLAAGTITPDLANGVYDVQVSAGNFAQVPVVGHDTTTDELTIDTTSPEVTYQQRITSDSTPTLTGTVVDNDPDTTVSVTILGVDTFDATNNGDGTWTLYGSAITTPLGTGIYDISVTALDTAGNVDVAVKTNGLNIQPPAFTVDVDLLTTGDTTPQLTGTVDDSTAIIKVTIEGTTYTATNQGDGTWTLADDTISPALADGTYEVIVTGTVDWNTVGTEVEGALVIDTTGPVVTIDSLATSDTTPELTGTIDSTTATINVTVNSNSYSATNNGDGTWTLADDTITPALPVGTYDVLVEATDDIGNIGSDATTDELIITVPIITDINLADLFASNGGDGSEGTVFQGVHAGDLTGHSAQSAGDINGDGFGDLIIAAPTADPISNNDGSVYIVFGTANGFPAQFDLSTLDGTNGFRVDALGVLDELGISVASAGDMNGDGLSDIVIGAHKADPNIFNEGAAYVIYGSTGPFSATFDLSTLNGTNGFVFEGEEIDDRIGESVHSAGDINGDGLDDLIIGSLNGDDGVTADTGQAYVIFGSTAAMPATWSTSALDGIVGFTLTGEATGDQAGFSVRGDGDINGDGLADLLIGAPGADSAAGKAYVVFGKTTGYATNIDLGALDGTNGFMVQGDTADMELGFSVSILGDHNGDGLADLLIGAPFSSSATETGAAYVIYGSTSAFSASITLASLDGTNGFTLLGVDNNSGGGGEDTGFSVSGIGDINADGFDDLLIGAPLGNKTGGYQNGQSYVLFGRAQAFTATVDLATVPGDTGFVINGFSVLDNAGYYVQDAGDVNGDGFNDLLVTARTASVGAELQAGETYLIYGRDFSGTVTDIGGTGAEVFTGTAARDAMAAGADDDELIGNGGPDVLSAGQGDDLLAIADASFVRLTGGTGLDTLRLDGAGITLDLTAISDIAITGIEQIDVRGSGANTLTLNVQEVLNLSDTSNTLLILTDSDDTVDIGTGWTAAGQEDIGGMLYDVFTQGHATVKQLAGVIDTTDPVVTVDALTTNDSTPQLSGTVVDTDPDTTVQVTVNAIAYTATNNGDGTWTLADDTITTALSDGTYDVSVTATDTSSNSGSDATTDELLIDTVAPTIWIDPIVTTDTTPELTGTVTDDDPTVAIELTINGATYTATNHGDGTWTLPNDTISPELAVGFYDVAALMTDAAGNIGRDVSINELVIESAAIPGDLDGDGFVGLDDLDIILNHWNQNVTIGDPLQGDITGAGDVPDGYVGLDDLDVLLNHWNEGTPPAAQASEASASESTASAQSVSVEQAAATSVQTVSVVDEATRFNESSTPEVEASTDDSGWGWMLQGSDSSRSAFADADKDGSDSVLDLAAPMDDAGI